MNEVINRLVDLLIGSNIGKTESERIASKKAGIDIVGVSWQASPQDFWWHVVNRAHTAQKMEKLFEAADQVFDENPKWAAAKQDYRTALTTPSPEPSFSAGTPLATVDLAFHERQLKTFETHSA